MTIEKSALNQPCEESKSAVAITQENMVALHKKAIQDVMGKDSSFKEEKRSAGKHFTRGTEPTCSVLEVDDFDPEKEESITSSQEELARLQAEEYKQLKD